jgi:hypothetical protein
MLLMKVTENRGDLTGGRNHRGPVSYRIHRTHTWPQFEARGVLRKYYAELGGMFRMGGFPTGVEDC